MAERILAPGDLADSIASLIEGDYINLLRNDGLLICFDDNHGVFITVEDNKLCISDRNIPDIGEEASYTGFEDIECYDENCKDHEDGEHEHQYYTPHPYDVVNHIHMNKFHDHIIKMLYKVAESTARSGTRVTPAIEKFIKQLANGATSDISVMQKAQRLMDEYFDKEG